MLQAAQDTRTDPSSRLGRCCCPSCKREPVPGCAKPTKATASTVPLPSISSVPYATPASPHRQRHGRRLPAGAALSTTPSPALSRFCFAVGCVATSHLCLVERLAKRIRGARTAAARSAAGGASPARKGGDQGSSAAAKPRGRGAAAKGAAKDGGADVGPSDEQGDIAAQLGVGANGAADAELDALAAVAEDQICGRGRKEATGTAGTLQHTEVECTHVKAEGAGAAAAAPAPAFLVGRCGALVLELCMQSQLYEEGTTATGAGGDGRTEYGLEGLQQAALGALVKLMAVDGCYCSGPQQLPLVFTVLRQR
jgi:hypothetical protein